MSHVSLNRLVEIMATLRDPADGCPWDLQQSHESLVPLTVEELSELADAIAKKDSHNTCEELGDILFHLVFHAQIADERGDFDMQRVIDMVADKMVRRHPHIFEGKVYENAEEQKADWGRIKAEEKALRPDTYENLSPLQKMDSLPAIAQSVAMQKQLAKMGFDWEHAHEVFAKIAEEADEIKVEMDNDDHTAIVDEYGDLLFAVMNLGRKLGVDPDMALRQANHKFYSRCEAMLAASSSVEAFTALTLDEKEQLWCDVKKAEQ